MRAERLFSVVNDIVPQIPLVDLNLNLNLEHCFYEVQGGKYTNK